MNENFDRKLWVLAQENAMFNYEQEHGIGTWSIDTDKYEREDWCFTEYERLVKEKENKNMKQARDAQGRFCKVTTETNNNTTNINSNNKKENNTMKKTMTNTEMRMETLKANGISTEKFFDLSMRIPMGAEVRILVDGKEMVVPAYHGNENGIIGNGFVNNFSVPTIISSNGDICNAETGEVLVMANDPIAQNIISDGYVKNSKLFRRYIGAQTIKLINYTDRRNSNRKGWEAGFKDMYGYEYCFKMMADELHTLAKLQTEDPEYFAERTKFFNGDVAVALLNDYLYRLKKYVRKQLREHPRTYRGEVYVKLAKYGNVLVKDLDTKVYAKVNSGIVDFMNAHARGNYKGMEKAFRDFMDKYYNKLPYETPKCATFKDAFKGSGAFYSLQNFIRYHKVLLEGCRNKYESEAKLYYLLNTEFKGCEWRFHQLLIDTIKYNNFDLRKSIADGNAAPNTTSTRVNA